MANIKMLGINTNDGIKKILGDLISSPENGSYYFEFAEAFMIEEFMTENGIQMAPVPIGPKAANAKYRIKKEFVVILPFDVNDNAKNIYQKLTSNIIIPEPIVKLS